MGKSFGVSFSLDTSELDKLRPLLTGKQLGKALDGGIRYAAKATPPSVAKQVSSRYGITSGRVKADTRGPYVSNNGEEIEAKLYFARRPPTGMQFKPRQGSSGLNFQFFKGQKTSIKGSFFQTVKNGRFAFKEDRSKLAKPTPGRKKPRYALKMIHGPSTGSIYLGQSKYGGEIREKVDERINEQFTKGVERKYKSMLRGYGFK